MWNAIDADAQKIVIEILRNEADGVVGYAVQDDGHGITPEFAREYFLKLGGSWKHLAARSPGDRPLHGKLGQGRFSAFDQGGFAKWTSVANVDGENFETVIEVSADDIDVCDISEPSPTTRPTGTRVELQGLGQPVRGLDGVAPRHQLMTKLALPIEAYGLTIVFDGERLDPSEIQNYRADYTLEAVGDQAVSMTVIEWSVSARRSLFLCNGAGIALHEMDPGFRVSDFRYSAYLKWDGFVAQLNELDVIEMGHGTAKVVLDASRERLLQHFEDRRGERRRHLVTKWRDEGVYPFAGEPATAVEEATRDTFDLVALQASDIINSGRGQAKKLSLRLLREALERSPGALHHVLRDVLNLDDEKVSELSALLEKTPLASVIAASTAIADRLEFLQGLAAMTTSPDWKKLILERSQLHKVLEKETWVFGEEYALAASDKGLTDVLARHVQLLGRDAPADNSAVVDAEGHRRIVDLMFNARIPQGENQRHHLVVELKRPKVEVGPTELEQTKNYALAVAKDDRFNTSSTRWEFWVVSSGVKGTADEDRRQKNKPFGLAVEYESHQIQIWIKTWADILQEAEHRLKFVQAKLGYSPGDQEALDYLRHKHAEHLPEVMLDVGTDGGSGTDAEVDRPDGPES